MQENRFCDYSLLEDHFVFAPFRFRRNLTLHPHVVPFRRSHLPSPLLQDVGPICFRIPGYQMYAAWNRCP